MKELRLLLAILERERTDLLERGTDAAEVTDIEGQISTIRRAIEVARRWLPERTHPRRGKISAESNVGIALAILRNEDHALHISDLIALMAKLYGREVKRGSLSSRLSKMAKAGEVFTLLRPGTFGLIEWSALKVADADQSGAVAATPDRSKETTEMN